MVTQINHMAIISPDYLLLDRYYRAMFKFNDSGRKEADGACIVSDGYVGLNLLPRRFRVPGHHVHAVAEQSHRRCAQLVAKKGCCPARLRTAKLENAAAHQLFDLVGSADGQKPAVVHQGNSIGAFGLVQVGGGNKNRYPLMKQLVEDPPEVAAR